MKTTLLLGLALLFGIVGHSRAQVVVELPGATVAGKTIAEWSAAWWQWAAALAPPGDPFTDATGQFANVNQSGPVFFLAGSRGICPGGSCSRHFTVPANTYVLVSLFASEWSQLELGFYQTAAQIRQAAQQQANQINSLNATLDGATISLTTLFTHREVSPDFNFFAMPDNQVNISPWGNSGIAVADGYFLMLAPMTPGTHVLSYGGGMSASHIFIDETDTITVVVPTVPTTRYVDVNSPSPTPPYTNWATAAVTIQDAVDAANDGDQVWVTNGVYQTGGKRVLFAVPLSITTNRVALDKAVTVQSVNGPLLTVIQGYLDPDEPYWTTAVRCACLTSGATLSGFTLTNGSTRYGEPGGGVWCQSATSVVTNCILVGNSSGGAGGGAYRGTLNNCILTGNSAHSGYVGGGAFSSVLNNCTLIGNSGYSGGGAFLCILSNCAVMGNSAISYGGGTVDCMLYNCTLSNNSVSSDGDAGGGASGGTLNNCTLSGNTVNGVNGMGGGAMAATLNNCILTGNSATTGGGSWNSVLNNCTLTGNSATYGGGSFGDLLTNCVVYFNTATNSQGANCSSNITPYYSCTTPMPANGIGNITNAPLFVNQAGGNFRLQSNSPCINAGDNSYAVGSTDLDGRPRITGGTVDMGAYEFQPGVSGEFIGWLQQYGLPTGGTADYSDSDSDLMNNWQEWVAGTVPTNAFSALRLRNPAKAVSGIAVTWQSVSNRTYFLERTANLGAPSSFSMLTSNIVGQAGTTSYADTNATGAGPFFYRVGVQQ